MKNNAIKLVFNRDFFKDRYSVLLFIALTILLLLNIGLVLVFSDPTSQQVIKTRYIGYGAGTFERGTGYDNFYLIAFALVNYASWVALSIKTFNVRKSLSMLQQYLGIVVMVILFFVSRALLFA